MEYKKQLIGRIESFYVDVVEEFKEAELQIMADSKFRSIFKKKDYDGNIAKLRSCKKDAQKIRTTDLQIPKKDKTAAEVVRTFEASIRKFNALCDAYISLQDALKKKAQKQPLKYSEYNEIFRTMKEKREALNEELHELDIIYTDYSYDENEDPYTFLNQEGSAEDDKDYRVKTYEHITDWSMEHTADTGRAGDHPADPYHRPADPEEG